MKPQSMMNEAQRVIVRMDVQENRLETPLLKQSTLPAAVVTTLRAEHRTNTTVTPRSNTVPKIGKFVLKSLRRKLSPPAIKRKKQSAQINGQRSSKTPVSNALTPLFKRVLDSYFVMATSLSSSVSLSHPYLEKSVSM